MWSGDFFAAALSRLSKSLGGGLAQATRQYDPRRPTAFPTPIQLGQIGGAPRTTISGSFDKAQKTQNSDALLGTGSCQSQHPEHCSTTHNVQYDLRNCKREAQPMTMCPKIPDRAQSERSQIHERLDESTDDKLNLCTAAAPTITGTSTCSALSDHSITAAPALRSRPVEEGWG